MTVVDHESHPVVVERLESIPKMDLNNIVDELVYLKETIKSDTFINSSYDTFVYNQPPDDANHSINNNSDFFHQTTQINNNNNNNSTLEADFFDSDIFESLLNNPNLD